MHRRKGVGGGGSNCLWPPLPPPPPIILSIPVCPFPTLILKTFLLLCYEGEKKKKKNEPVHVKRALTIYTNREGSGKPVHKTAQPSLFAHTIYEPRHDKTNKATVRPAKTQNSLGIRPVWSESSLCAQLVTKDPGFLHTDSEDSDQTGRKFLIEIR